MNVDPAVIHLGRFAGEHWLGLIVTAVVMFLLSPLVTFPGGNPKTLWWVCGGSCLAACFFIYWGFYLLIASLSSDVTSSAPAPPLTLKNLFDTDFPSGSFGSEITFTSKLDGSTWKIPYRVVTDFSSRTKYLAFYVADSPDAFDRCKILAANLQLPFEAIDKSVYMAMTDAGGTSITESKDLVFTGRVYIYYESPFSLNQLAILESIFAEKKAAVEFRGQAYLVLHWHDKRQLPDIQPTTNKSAGSPTSERHISDENRAIFKENLSADAGQKFVIACIAFDDDKEVVAFAKELGSVLMKCGWVGQFYLDNFDINFSGMPVYSGISLWMFDDKKVEAFNRLEETMIQAGIKMSLQTERINKIPAVYGRIEIIVGPNPDT